MQAGGVHRIAVAGRRVGMVVAPAVRNDAVVRGEKLDLAPPDAQILQAAVDQDQRLAAAHVGVFQPGTVHINDSHYSTHRRKRFASLQTIV